MFSIFKNGWKAFFETLLNDYMFIYLCKIDEFLLL